MYCKTTLCIYANVFGQAFRFVFFRSASALERAQITRESMNEGVGRRVVGKFPIQKVDRKLTFKSANPHPRSLWRDQWGKRQQGSPGSVRFGRRFHSHRWWVVWPGDEGMSSDAFYSITGRRKKRPFFTLTGVTLTRFPSVKHHIQHHYTPFCWIGRTSLFRARVDVWYMDRMKENVAFFSPFFFQSGLFSILGTKTALTLVDYFPAHWNSNGIRVLRLFFWFIEKKKKIGEIAL